MPSLVYLTVLIELTGTLGGVATQDIALGVNTKLKEPQTTIPLRTNSFIELISKGIFVDKTLLLEAILRDLAPIPLAITFPRGWGKTTSLDMVKKFLQMPIHANGTRILPISNTSTYRLFKEAKYRSEHYDVQLEKPFLISHEKYNDIFDKHFGQYPVIEFSFPDKVILNESEYESILRQSIAEAFNQHTYMLRIFDDIIGDEGDGNDKRKQRAKLDKKNFQYFVKSGVNTLDLNELAVAVLDLFKILKRHFEKKVVVLIDNFDRFISCLDEPVRYFFNGILKNNRYLQTGIFAGTLPLSLRKESWQIANSANISYHYFPHSKQFQRYFAFTAGEMNLIYDFYRIPVEEQKHIRYWYGGYKDPEDVAEEIFNPLSVRNYLATRQFRPYWVEANSDDIYLHLAFESPLYQFRFTHVLTSNAPILQPKFPLAKWNLISLDDPFNRDTLNYLAGGGYLMVKKIKHSDTRKRKFEIPNYEIASHLQRVYAAKLTDKVLENRFVQAFRNCSLKWEQFLQTNESESRELEDITYKFVDPLFEYFDQIEEYYDRGDQKRALFNSITIAIVPSSKFHFIGWQFGIPSTYAVDDTLTQPDILLSSESRGIIIYVVYGNNTATSIMNHTSQHTAMFEKYATFHRWKDVKIVDCRVFPDKGVEITSTIHAVNLGQ